MGYWGPDKPSDGDVTQKQDKQDPTRLAEQKLVAEIIKNQQAAEAARGTGTTETEAYGIEQTWEDESKMLIGDQWTTSIAYRTKAVRKQRPNSVDNFIFPAVINTVANIVSSDPEVTLEGTEDGDQEVAEKLTFLSRFNDKRNKFPATWKKMVQQFVAYGPAIGAVLWDSDWMGGAGPNRWVGDVRILYVDRRSIYFDPAITDLEERLQECGFINRKFRKKISYIHDRWPDSGQSVTEDYNDIMLQDEGQDPQSVWLIESRHRGLPRFMPEQRKRELLKKASEAELTVLSAPPDPFKAQEYRDMAAGKLKGVHVAYIANGVFLEYMPYEYDDGLYPFVYKTCYYDENSPHGFGEIRNIKTPQIMHNKADEIEIEAMSREGLGGMYHNTGAVTAKQKAEIVKNSGKGGALLEVTNINQMRDREGVKVPASVVAYKEHKQRMVETISQNTPIQQGMAPRSGMPYKAIAELGARMDIRTKLKVSVLEDFLIELNQLRINRFVQFYTEDRYYRLKGADNKVIEGQFNARELKRSWKRQTLDDSGNATGNQSEFFVPDFDVSVKIMDEKPTDRNYYTQTAVQLYGQKAMDLQSLWYTLEEGRFPQSKEILERLASQDQTFAMAQMLGKLPPEMGQQFMLLLQQMIQGGMGQDGMQGGPQGGPPQWQGNPAEMGPGMQPDMMIQPGAGQQPGMEQQPDQNGANNGANSLLDILPDDILQMLQSMPQDQQEQYLYEMMQMDPEELVAYIEQVRSEVMQ